jgi:hypothetical protein
MRRLPPSLQSWSPSCSSMARASSATASAGPCPAWTPTEGCTSPRSSPSWGGRSSKPRCAGGKAAAAAGDGHCRRRRLRRHERQGCRPVLLLLLPLPWQGQPSSLEHIVALVEHEGGNWSCHSRCVALQRPGRGGAAPSQAQQAPRRARGPCHGEAPAGRGRLAVGAASRPSAAAAACRRSTAVLEVLRHLGMPWKLAYACMLVPAALRDAVYGLGERAGRASRAPRLAHLPPACLPAWRLWCLVAGARALPATVLQLVASWWGAGHGPSGRGAAPGRGPAAGCRRPHCRAPLSPRLLSSRPHPHPTSAAPLHPAAVARNRYEWFGARPGCALPARVQAASEELLRDIIAGGGGRTAAGAAVVARGRPAASVGPAQHRQGPHGRPAGSGGRRRGPAQHPAGVESGWPALPVPSGERGG